nr:PREDICTED: 28S ribosomal protein S25, mitochondrial [Apteryx mantelli mantelli]
MSIVRRSGRRAGGGCPKVAFSYTYLHIFLADTGEQVLVDVEDKTNKEIMEHVKKILGKSKETLEKEEKERKKLSHPATFGPKKYHLRECMCEIEGQVPCPAFVPLPKEMRGKYKATMKNEASA